MKVLITGGAGFIGSHLADACIARGDSVVVLDDLSTGRIDNIAHLLSDPQFHFIEGGICDAGVVARLVDQCDAVYHLAAALGMRRVVEMPLLTFKTNVMGCDVVFDAAALRSKPVLYTSTSEFYGLSDRKPSVEGHDSVLGAPWKNRWSYAYSKAAGEVLASAYHRERGLRVITVRLFNTVGPRQTGRYGMVLPNFVRQALAGEPLIVHGDGSQTRCFGDVREIARGLAGLMNHPGAAGETFNVGANREISILDLAKLVVKLTGSTSEIVFMSHDKVYEPGFEEIKRRIPDTSKIRSLIGFNPVTTTEEIVTNVIAEHRQRQVAV